MNNLPRAGYGDAMISPDNRYYWILVPRNASSWISANLAGMGWTRKNFIHAFKLPKDITPIIILNDPVSRWLSGMVFLVGELYPRLGRPLPQEFIDLLFHTIVFSDHSESQSNFLIDVNLNKLIAFKISDSLNHEVASFFKKENYPVLDDIHERVDPARNDLLKSQVVPQLLKELDKKEKRERIEEYFLDDYTLLRKMEDNE